MSWWHYLLLVNFYLVLFFGFYVLLLRRETFFQLNRIYLVAASLLSFLIPVIQADWVKDLFITQQVQSTIYSMPVMAYEITFTPAPDVLTVGEVINALYISITLFLILRLLWQLVILKKAIEKPEPSAAYSFFKKISLGKDIANRDVIAAHELVHARQWHSVDVMIIETVMIINWFNPVVYLYRFAIKLIHEFIADRQVVQGGTDKADYALLLLSQTFEVETHQLVIPFYNHSLLKNRIMMLQKNKSQRIALVKYGLSAPLFAIMLIFSSATVNNSKAVTVINNHAEDVLEKPAAEAVKAITASTPFVTDEPIYVAVETQPSFPGGMQKFYEYLSSVIKYPAIDKKNNITGKVYINFIVEKDGTLSNIKSIRGPSATIEAEGVRAMKASPKWEPGIQKGKAVRVNYTIPINFSLDKNVTQKPDTKVFSTVERAPNFPGGMKKFFEFVSKTVRYPKIDQENNITGKAYASFIVETDGSLSNIKILKAPSPTIQAEALRVMELSPKWNPGIQNGKLVRVSYTLPLTFTLDGVATAKVDDKVFSAVEQQPNYPGGMSAFFEFVQRTVRYPAIDQKNNVTGKVYINFIVEADGSLSNIKAIRGPSATLQEEGERIIKASPKWTPGVQNGRYVRVNYTIPINFSLNKPVLGTTTNANGTITLKGGTQGDNPLYIIDGKVVDTQSGASPLQAISQDDIANIEILKDASATSLYGDRGKNGVIKVSTKNYKKPAPPIAIRGTGKSPLFIIDGAEADEDDFNKISPDKIEGISILKDASAATYGDKAKGGVIIVTTKGYNKKPAPSISIRGTGKSPLFVIDGVEADESDFNKISPDKVENISILKDASGATYGDKAKNGVVIVTTKGSKKAADKKP